MKKWLARILALLCLLLIAVVARQWVGNARMGWRRAFLQNGDNWSIDLGDNRWTVQAHSWNVNALEFGWYEAPRVRDPSVSTALREERWFAGFDYCAYGPPAHTVCRLFFVPWWFILTVLSLWPLRQGWVELRRWKKRRLEPGAVPCAHCGYDLRAHAAGGACPECGKPIPLAASPRPSAPAGSITSPPDSP